MLREPKILDWLKRVYARIRGNRKAELMLYIGAAALALLLFMGSFLPGAGDTTGGEPKDKTAAATKSDEQRLREVLGRIRGAGDVDVMITYESGAELVMAMSTDVNTEQSETSDGEKTSRTEQTTEVSAPAVVGGSSGEPVVLMEKEPVVRGVIVVADGAADVKVRLDLQRAVRAVLDVPISRIEVFERAAAAE